MFIGFTLSSTVACAGCYAGLTWRGLPWLGLACSWPHIKQTLRLLNEAEKLPWFSILFALTHAPAARCTSTHTHTHSLRYHSLLLLHFFWLLFVIFLPFFLFNSHRHILNALRRVAKGWPSWRKSVSSAICLLLFMLSDCLLSYMLGGCH